MNQPPHGGGSGNISAAYRNSSKGKDSHPAIPACAGMADKRGPLFLPSIAYRLLTSVSAFRSEAGPRGSASLPGRSSAMNRAGCWLPEEGSGSMLGKYLEKTCTYMESRRLSYTSTFVAYLLSIRTSACYVKMLRRIAYRKDYGMELAGRNVARVPVRFP